jgi:hypothetical protein
MYFNNIKKKDFETLFESGMIESQTKTINIEEEENEELFRELIKFIYEGKIEITDKKKLLSFILLSNKVKIYNNRKIKVFDKEYKRIKF